MTSSSRLDNGDQVQVELETTAHDDLESDARTGLKDTQVIQSLNINFSQPSRLKDLKMLSQNEENKIYDSSSDYRDTHIDTQEMLAYGADNNNQTSEIVVESSDRGLVRSDETDFGMKETQKILEPPDAKAQADIELPSNDDVLNMPLPDTLESKVDDKSSWMKQIRDPLTDSQTPWLNKIKDPFQETPVGSRVQETPSKTPDTTSKKTHSLYTPVPSGHKIFDKLREDQRRPELEVESQTQSAPNLLFNSLTESTIQATTQLSSSELSDHPGHFDTQVDLPSMKLHRLQENNIPENSPSQGNQDVVVNADERMEIDDPSNIEIDAVKLPEAEPPQSQSERKLEATQDDIQVLGTAPDNVIMRTSQLGSSPVGNAYISDNTNKVDVHEDMDLASGIAVDKEDSSPVVSDDGNRSSSDMLEESKANAYTASYMLAEDSIQKYHRDFTKKTGTRSDKDSEGNDKRFQSLKTLKHLKTFSEGVNNEMLKLPFSLQPPRRSHTDIEDKGEPVESAEFVGPVHRSTVSGPESSTKEQESSEIGANITQELSDIDDEDDEGKVNNTIDEEVASIALSKKNNVEDDSGVAKFRRKTRRKSVGIVGPSRPLRKKSRIETEISPNSQTKISNPIIRPTSSELTDVADPNTSFHNTVKMHDEETKYPQEILRKENAQLSRSDIIFKDYVWCQYNAHYYPGLIAGIGEKGFIVKFVDSTDEMSLVYPLDLRIGDHVRVGKFDYVVSGLECLADADAEVIRCMRGYDTVIVKPLRKAKGRNNQQRANEEKFPIGLIKMENDDWFKIKRVGLDNFTKPRRNAVKDFNHTVSSYQDELLISTPQKMDFTVKSDIFARCLFVITGDIQKDNLAELIQSHGGTVIEDGFSSLVHLETSENFEPITTAKGTLNGFKFGALISNKHVRSPKFLETLALGWPLLETSFIHDSINAGYLKADFLTTYSLPSGESKRLKFLKSHNIRNYLNNLDLESNLSGQLSNNRLLKNRHVILINTNPDIIKFIFFILGAKTVTITTLTNYSNLIHTLSHLTNTDLPVIIYHEKMKALRAGLEDLESSHSHEKLRKTKRSNLLTSQFLPVNNPVSLQLVDWEWVVQCLIDGCPWPSETKTI